MNDLIYQAIAGTNRQRAPVWLMRQAGRYMPSYQQLRKKHSLGELFRSSSLIRQITLLPIEELHVDAAIIFSDILLIAETIGGIVTYPERSPPVIAIPKLTDPYLLATPWFDLATAIDQLQQLNYLYEGIALVKQDLSVPLFGFCAAPFTLLCYLLDQHDRKTYPITMSLLNNNPSLFQLLLDQLCELSIHYAHLQINAGVDLFQLFESCGSILSQEQFHRFSLPYLERMTHAIAVPCISFIKGACKHIESLKNSSLSLLSIDSDLPLHTVRNQLGEARVLQGNLDPQLLLQEEHLVESNTRALLESMQGDPRFILNLGHGVLPGTPYNNVVRFVKTAIEFGQNLK